VLWLPEGVQCSQLLSVLEPARETCKDLAALLEKQAATPVRQQKRKVEQRSPEGSPVSSAGGSGKTRNWLAWGRVYTSLRNRLSLETAEKMVYVKANMSSSAATEGSMITSDHMVVDARVGT
jgi:hypothetical protein